MRKFFGCFVILALLAPAAALAKRDRNDNEDVGDPNRVICRTESEIGTRLGKIRRCHTAAQWAYLKRETRNTIERVQSIKPTSGN
jgi:hypothetical protein